MRKKIILIILAIIGLCSFSCSNKSKNQQSEEGLNGNITLSGAFAIYPITVRWAEEFQKLHPSVRIDISAGGAGKGMADALSQMVDLGMFSRGITQEEIDKGAWYIAVTKDAVLPTINSKNPLRNSLLERGLKKEEFKDIYLNKKITYWNDLVTSAPKLKINVYTRSDACGAAQMWAQYLGTNQEDLAGTGVFGDPGIADAVKQDGLGIGYNNVIYLYDIKSRKKYDGIEVIPIDLNENGKVDENEDFYNLLDSVMKAIKEEIYPAPPARDLYYVSKGKPEKRIVIEFLKWILTDGQQYLTEAGYVALPDEKIKQELNKLE